MLVIYKMIRDIAGDIINSHLDFKSNFLSKHPKKRQTGREDDYKMNNSFTGVEV